MERKMVRFSWKNSSKEVNLNEEYFRSIVDEMKDLNIQFFYTTDEFRSTQKWYDGYTIYLDEKPNDKLLSLIDKSVKEEQTLDDIDKLEHWVQKVPGGIYFLQINNR